MKLQQIILSLTISVLTSCNSKTTNEVQSVAFPAVSNVLLQEQLSETEFIQLETTEESLIGGITDIQCTKERIYVLDFMSSKSVFEFDKSGKFIKKLSSVGNGPGEYVMPRSFAIDLANKRLLLLDVSVGKVLEYDLQTFEFLRATPMEGTSLSYHNDCLYMYDTNSEVIADTPKAYHVHCYDQKLNYTGSYVPIAFETGYMSGPNRRFSVFDNNVRFIPPFSDQVVEINKGVATPLYQFKFEQGEIPPLSFLETHGNSLYQELKKEKYINYFNFMESSSFLFVPYANNENRYAGIYDKKSKKSLSFPLSDKNSWTSQFYPIGMDNDKILFFSPANDIEEYNDSCPENLKALIQQRADGSNPIIMLTSIKHIK